MSVSFSNFFFGLIFVGLFNGLLLIHGNMVFSCNFYTEHENMHIQCYTCQYTLRGWTLPDLFPLDHPHN